MSTPRKSAWVDPAPLEISRPRLPWWTYLPGWWKLLLAPVVLIIVTGWLLVQLVRGFWHYPLTAALALVTVLTLRWLGVWWLIGISAAVLVGLVVWWRLRRDTFRHVVAYPVRSEWRRATVYALLWRSVVRLAGLTGDAKGREHRPALVRVRHEGWRDVVRVTMIRGQAPEQWEQRATGLAHSFGARSCRVRVLKPGRLALDFLRRDPLTATLPAPPLAHYVPDVEQLLSGVDIGLTESGQPWRIRLQGNQIMIVGVQGAGKASILWSIIRRLAPAIKAGLVQVVGIDPKGGMELGQCPEAFTQVVYDNGEAAVELLERIAAEVKDRAAAFRGVRRKWTVDSGYPFLLLIIDELADIIAYQTDRKLRERGQLALQTITSQGRAPGVCVVALLQDPRKEIVPFRNLFPYRIALRLDEAIQTDMVLGDGVRKRGAHADEIPESMPGTAWVKEDGKREPVRARASYPTDTDLAELRAYLTDQSAPVVPFPQRGEGGVAA